MPIRNNRHPQWTVTLKTLYRSDRAERSPPRLRSDRSRTTTPTQRPQGGIAQ